LQPIGAPWHDQPEGAGYDPLHEADQPEHDEPPLHEADHPEHDEPPQQDDDQPPQQPLQLLQPRDRMRPPNMPPCFEPPLHDEPLHE